MDAECISICDAINSIPGLCTAESCCGHGEWPFKVYFMCESLEHLPVLLYYCNPCHVGFRWWCRVKTDCAMSPVVFVLESEAVGEVAYREAGVIAEEIMGYLVEEDNAVSDG